MNNKILLENLAVTTTKSDLMALFSAYGVVEEISIPKDQTNGKSRGFGCVTMATREGAKAALDALNGKVNGAATLIVAKAESDKLPASTPYVRPNPRRRAPDDFTDPALNKPT